ncbi:MAG: DUF4097 family beta strand repeat-containing protein [Woeseiaceae bacterium]
MNYLKRLAAIGVTCSAIPAAMADAREQRNIEQVFKVGNSPVLTVKNIWGNVRVVSGANGVIKLEAREIRVADDDDDLAYSKEVLPLRIEQDGDEVRVIVGRQFDDWEERRQCHGCRAEYQFLLTVPAKTALNIRAINDGVIDIQSVSGVINAKNVNGPIAVSELSACDEIDSVNGDVTLSMNRGLATACYVKTINGDISITMSEPHDMELAVSQRNGRMYTDFPLTSMAIGQQVSTDTSRKKTRYRISQDAGFRLGRGGQRMTISSLNGDFTIQEGRK